MSLWHPNWNSYRDSSLILTSSVCEWKHFHAANVRQPFPLEVPPKQLEILQNSTQRILGGCCGNCSDWSLAVPACTGSWEFRMLPYSFSIGTFDRRGTNVSHKLAVSCKRPPQQLVGLPAVMSWKGHKDTSLLIISVISMKTALSAWLRKIFACHLGIRRATCG